ncbi:hypothetical protein Tco_1541289 [Tanacetum coccineum]
MKSSRKSTDLTANTPYYSRPIRLIQDFDESKDHFLTLKNTSLEEENARKRRKVFNWEPAKYGKIWYDEDVHDLRSVETKFPAIIFNDNLTSNETLSCEPTVSSLNDNEIDFRISFDESDDEDYMLVFDKNLFSYKIISTNDLETDSENDNEKVNMPSFPSPKPTVSNFNDLDFFKEFENEFPTIVYNYALTSKSDLLTEPTISLQHIDEFLKDETSLSEHNPVSVCDSEETLILAEESRLKMLEKQSVFNTKPVDYSKLNKLYEIFYPQTQLSAKKLYWSSIPSPPVTVSKPKVFPKKLPSTSEVLRNLNKARDLLTKFDECIKRRTTLSPHEIGSWQQSDIKGSFKANVIPFSENLKETFKFSEKGFITVVKEMKDIFEQMEDEVDQYLQESNKSLSELRKRFAKLEEYNITLDIAFQNHKEQMILNEPETKNKPLLVKTINNQFFEINDLKVQLQDKLHVINELKHLLAQKSQKTQCESPIVDSRIQKIEDENVSLAFQVSSLVKEREHIKLEYKKLYDSIKQTRAKTKL